MRKMKDSGIEWIGEIPESWDVSKLLYFLRSSISDGPHETPEVLNEGVPFISVDSLNDSEKIDFSVVKKFISEEQYLEYQKKANLEEGDVLFTKAATIGKTAIVGNEKFMVWSPIAIIKPEAKKLVNKYLYYLLNCKELINDVILSGSYNTQINVGMREIENARIPVVSVDEQSRISNYLDQKCAEIDAIISAKEKTNELLKERRQSIIYEAVTKGLDPTVPMKDSGIEWIGEIPESWSVWRLKHLLCQEKGAIKAGPFGSSITANDMQGGDVKVFTQRTVLDNDFLSGDEYISFDKYKDLKGFSVKTGDILITTRGTIGKTAIVPKNSFGILHPCLIKMSIDSDKINKSLLCRIFNETNIFEEQLRLASNATTIDVIYTQNLLNIFVPLAPLHEQDRICKYLNEKCESLDYLISSNDSTIKKLKEYRQSVIYEAVTGKIEI